MQKSEAMSKSLLKKKKNSSPIFTNEPETVAVHGKSNQSHKVV